jgi:hypothetical protein
VKKKTVPSEYVKTTVYIACYASHPNQASLAGSIGLPALGLAGSHGPRIKSSYLIHVCPKYFR